MKYNLLVNILDQICKEAPKEMGRYYYNGDDVSKITNRRSRAYIHLYLKVKFGICNFKDRENLITDQSQDGGLDAYYIDQENKIVYLIQSKFRANTSNFETKEIDINELVHMEIGRITKGEELDSSGVPYNEKIKAFKNKISQISDIARYDFKVIILANLTKYNEEQISKVIEGFDYEVFNYERTYNELVYPMCTSTYYNKQNIDLIININEKSIQDLTEDFETTLGTCEVSIVFVPVIEIAKAMDKYKNTILKYNPRNYLSLSRNSVNKKIKGSIIDKENNDFAILNNGITIVCDEYSSTSKTGKKNKCQVAITNPQFINGGQTSYTLSKILVSDDKDKLLNKKVMLKVITIPNDENINYEEEENYLNFIQEISNATNMQTKVDEADRRANEVVQIELQRKIYSQYGYLYERKNGEFESAISEKYIGKEIVIDRSTLVRSYSAFKGNAAFARTSSGDKLFKIDTFTNIIESSENYKEMFLAYCIFKRLTELDKLYRKNSYNTKEWGNSLRYGKYSVVTATYHIKESLHKADKYDSYDEVYTLSNKLVNLALLKWVQFENYVESLDHNKNYFSNESKEFDNYYKGSTIDKDLKSFFEEIEILPIEEACMDTV